MINCKHQANYVLLICAIVFQSNLLLLHSVTQPSLGRTENIRCTISSEYHKTLLKCVSLPSSYFMSTLVAAVWNGPQPRLALRTKCNLTWRQSQAPQGWDVYARGGVFRINQPQLLEPTIFTGSALMPVRARLARRCNRDWNSATANR